MSLYEGDYIEQFFLGFLIDVDKHDKGRVPVTFVGVTVSTKGICIYNIYIHYKILLGKFEESNVTRLLNTAQMAHPSKGR